MSEPEWKHQVRLAILKARREGSAKIYCPNCRTIPTDGEFDRGDDCRSCGRPVDDMVTVEGDVH